MTVAPSAPPKDDAAGCQQPEAAVAISGAGMIGVSR